MTSILAGLEAQDESNNAACLLKTLLLLDLVISEHLGLQRVASYSNGQLINLDPSISSGTPALRDLIGLYYGYVKEKAKCLKMLDPGVTTPLNRTLHIKKLSVSAILRDINMCFKVQNLILTLSENYGDGNKSTALIQTIFSSLLRTYLYFYSIVSMGLSEFTSTTSTYLREDPQPQ